MTDVLYQFFCQIGIGCDFIELFNKSVNRTNKVVIFELNNKMIIL